MALPPLPQGFVFERPDAGQAGPPPGSRPDPWSVLEAEGFTATNGYRTRQDRERIRAQGYNPSPTSFHERADGVDLDHPRLSRAEQERRVRALAAQYGWNSAEIINEGHHIHLGIPGWGAAPGTPGTPNSGLPAIPAGFELEQRGSLADGNFLTGEAPAVMPAAPPVPSNLDERSFQRQLALIFANHRLTPDQRIEAANALGAANGLPLNQDDLRLAAERGTGAIDFQDDYADERRAALGVSGEITARVPGYAERLGDVVGDVASNLVGTYQGQRFGNQVEGLLDWTTVGDADAFNEFSEGRDRAAQEGRYLDYLGNTVGRDVAAVSMIPIVGPAIRGVKRGARVIRDAAGRIVRGGDEAADLGATASREAIAAADVADEAPEIVVAAPGRAVDRIDVRELPPLPEGYTLEPPIGRVAPLGEQPSPDDLAAAARGIRPESVLPIPGNRVESLDEARRANPGTIRDVDAPEPRRELEMRYFPHPSRPGERVGFRGPLDAETFLRAGGGVQDQGGELSHIGLTNKARPEAPGEDRLGRIVNPNGMTLDEAGEALWEAGYFTERPSVAEVVDMLRAGRVGQRAFRPDDLDEVARFEGAQAQRYQAEAAEQEGRPLAEQVGEPVGLDDLRANDPPATAYEDLPRVGGKVGNINLANLESIQDIRRLLQNVETRFGGFDAARRGKITHAETERLASELGMTADDLLRRRKGQALNAEQALAARQLMAKSGDEVLRLAERATGPAASDETRTAFSEALLRHAAIHEQVTGAVAEAGRALSAMRAAARSRALSGRIHQATIDGMGGHKKLEDIAGRILELQRKGVEPGAVNRFAVNAVKPGFRDKLVELWYNALLSGPQTHVVNVLSNMLTAGLQIPEHAAAAGVGAGRRGVRAVRGKPDDFDRVMASELGPRLVGLMQGAQEGLRAFSKTLRTGEVPDFITKVESRSQEAISGLKGKVVRTPSRLLAAEDEFFKATARRMELNALAVRMARSEGLKGQAFRERVAGLAANPTDVMLEKVLDYSRYLTFQRPLEGFPLDVSRFSQRQPWVKLFLPFIRTPTNIFKFAVERSPFAPVLREVRENFKAGGARRDLALARIALGTGLAMLVSKLAADGLITGGGPSDRGQLDLLRADGWQPYSIRLGDKYYSYQRLDPLAMTLGTAADMVNLGEAMSEGDVDQAGAMLISSVIGGLSNKTWLSGLTDVFGVIDDPQRNLTGFMSRLAGSIAVPTLGAQIARTADPVLRDTRGDGVIDSAWKRIQSRIPGVSQSLPAKRDAWGRVITSEGGLGPNIASPIWQSTAENDPLIAELLNIGEGLGRPSRHLTVDGVKRELTAEEYGRYQELSGRYVRDDLIEAMSDPEWAELDNEEKRAWVKDIKRDARADARADLFEAPPPLPPGFEPEGGAVPPAAPALPPLPPGFELAQ